MRAPRSWRRRAASGDAAVPSHRIASGTRSLGSAPEPDSSASGVRGRRPAAVRVRGADQEGAPDEVAEADEREVPGHLDHVGAGQAAVEAERERRHVGDDVLEAGRDEHHHAPEHHDQPRTLAAQPRRAPDGQADEQVAQDPARSAAAPTSRGPCARSSPPGRSPPGVPGARTPETCTRNANSIAPSRLPPRQARRVSPARPQPMTPRSAPWVRIIIAEVASSAPATSDHGQRDAEHQPLHQRGERRPGDGQRAARGGHDEDADADVGAGEHGAHQEQPRCGRGGPPCGGRLPPGRRRCRGCSAPVHRRVVPRRVWRAEGPGNRGRPTAVATARDPSLLAADPAGHHVRQPRLAGADVPVLGRGRQPERLAPGAPGLPGGRRVRAAARGGHGGGPRGADLAAGHRAVARPAHRRVAPDHRLRARARHAGRRAAGARGPQGVDVSPRSPPGAARSRRTRAAGRPSARRPRRSPGSRRPAR